MLSIMDITKELCVCLTVLIKLAYGQLETSIQRSVTTTDSSDVYLRHMEWRLQTEIAENQAELRDIRHDLAIIQAILTANSFRLQLQSAAYQLNSLLQQIQVWETQFEQVKSSNESAHLWAETILESSLGYPKVFWTLSNLNQLVSQKLTYSGSYLEIFIKSMAISPAQSQRWLAKIEAYRLFESLEKSCQLWFLANQILQQPQNLRNDTCYHHQSSFITASNKLINKVASPIFSSPKVQLQLFDSYRRDAQIFTNINGEMIIPYPRANSQYFGYSPIVGCKLGVSQTARRFLQIQCKILTTWESLEKPKVPEDLDDISPPQLSLDYSSYEGYYTGYQFSDCWSRVNRTDNQFICGLRVASNGDKPTSISILACSRQQSQTVVDGWLHSSCPESRKFSYQGLVDVGWVLPEIMGLVTGIRFTDKKLNGKTVLGLEIETDAATPFIF